MIDTDQLAKAADRPVSRETFKRVSQIVDMVRDETLRQNLISPTTVDDIWHRHVLDSAQLLRLADQGPWLDLGTGAGFPGLIIAAFGVDQVVLCEQRRLRHEFLARVIEDIGLTNARVVGSKIERVDSFAAATISARAFAPLDRLLTLSNRFSTEKTRWVLPKGRSAREELASIKDTWHGDFRLEPSVTDTEAAIIVAQNVSPRRAV